MTSLVSRLSRLEDRSREATRRSVWVSVWGTGPAVDRYEDGWTGCDIPAPDPELAEAMRRASGLTLSHDPDTGATGGTYAMGLDREMDPDDAREWRDLLLANAVDHHQRAVLAAASWWFVVLHFRGVQPEPTIN